MTAVEVLGVVEWLAGTTERFIYQGGPTQNGELKFYRHEPQPAPVHYGCLPAYWNPIDNAEVDAIWLQAQAALGQERCEAPTGLLHLADGDHKVLFGPVTAESLARLLPWFTGRGAEVLPPEAAWAFLQENERNV